MKEEPTSLAFAVVALTVVLVALIGGMITLIVFNNNRRLRYVNELAEARRLREQEVIWRLAFDCLQREVRGVDEYLPVPNLQKSLLAGSCEALCDWAAERKGFITDIACFEPEVGR